MTPDPAAPNQNDETARSLPTARPVGDRTAVDADTGASGPTDATMVRVGTNAPTVNEMADAANFGKYQLVGELARGGMGVVYRAKQRGLDRLVALKMILGTDTDHEAAQRFLQEARAAAALDHPNVVPIYDIDEIGGRPYFTMALIEGPNLRGYVDAHGLPEPPTLVSLFAQIVAGVAHAHRHGIVHRDLKPANVLIDKDGRPRVTDFGLAKRSSAEAQLTVTGQVVGTPAYMAPEQARDSKDVGPPADVYSLGAVLYFMLTGKPPFQADSVTDLLIKVVMEEPAAPRLVRPDVPADIEELCLRCLSKKPADRFPDAQELLAALAPIADKYLVASASLSPSVAQFALAKGPTVPSLGSMAYPGGTGTVPSLGGALAMHPAASPAPAPAPGPPAHRKPVLIALGAVALVLLAAGAYLATRDRAKPDVAAPDKVIPPAASAERFAWPAASRADFGLTVESDSEQATRDANGVPRLTADKPLRIRLKADRDCRVSVWWTDPAGQVQRIFPNKFETDDRVRAGQERVVPGNGQYEISPSVTEGDGNERLRVIAVTGAAPAFPPGTENGPFVVYAGEAEREKLASTVRGLVLKKTGTAEPSTPEAVSEREFLFRVQK